MHTYLGSKISIRAAFVSEIQLLKEETIRIQLEAYRLELQEELRIALEGFRLAQAALLESVVSDSTEPQTSTEESITEAEFIANLEKLNEER